MGCRSTIIRSNKEVRYFDKHGVELAEGDKVRFADGSVKELYLTEDGELGTDATNPSWVSRGWAAPCEFGIYPLEYSDMEDIERI